MRRLPRSPVKIVITGHVDHGKSTLIGRLLLDTGSLPDERIRELEHLGKQMGKDAELAFLVDQLREERERLATHDTTQRRFRYRGKEFVIIDTPGHAEFIRGMLTGATQADAAVLVIDAREGIQDQTRRHFSILRLIGIRDIIVVVNKMDTVSYSRAVFDRLAANARSLCTTATSGLIAVIPASARNGDNILTRSKNLSWYRGKTLGGLLNELAQCSVPAGNRLRFAVQDVYQFDGHPLCVGRVESGCLRMGQAVAAFPSRVQFTVRRIVTWPQRRRSQARAGENIGIVFKEASAPHRGDVLAGQREKVSPWTQALASVFWLADAPWQGNETLLLRCATQKAEATLLALAQRLDTSSLQVLTDTEIILKKHEIGQVNMEFSAPLILEHLATIPGLARFTLERAGQICGIGVIP